MADNLHSMNVAALRRRAADVGVPASQIEDARDSIDPKSALIALISNGQIAQSRDGGIRNADVPATMVATNLIVPEGAITGDRVSFGPLADGSSTMVTIPEGAIPGTSVKIMVTRAQAGLPMMEEKTTTTQRAAAIDRQLIGACGPTGAKSQAKPLDMAKTYRPGFFVRYLRPNTCMPGFVKPGASCWTMFKVKYTGPCAYMEVEQWLGNTDATWVDGHVRLVLHHGLSCMWP
jgi:hypothetical protein